MQNPCRFSGAEIDRIGEYVMRWLRWLKAGVEKVEKVMGCLPYLREVMLE